MRQRVTKEVCLEQRKTTQQRHIKQSNHSVTTTQGWKYTLLDNHFLCVVRLPHSVVCLKLPRQLSLPFRYVARPLPFQCVKRFWMSVTGIYFCVLYFFCESKSFFLTPQTYSYTYTYDTYVQAVRDVQGRTLRPFVYWLALAGNLGLQAIGSLFSHLIATWFGPVSVVVPIYYAATLLSNMFIFGIVLGTRVLCVCARSVEWMDVMTC